MDTNGRPVHYNIYYLCYSIFFLFSIHPSENCLLQRAAGAGNEAAALFLATHGAKVNHANKWVCYVVLQYHVMQHSSAS